MKITSFLTFSDTDTRSHQGSALGKTGGEYFSSIIRITKVILKTNHGQEKM